MTQINSNGDITTVRGDTFPLVITDVKENNAVIEWAGWRAKFCVREYPEAENAILELDESNGIDLSVDGQIIIIVSAEDMANIEAGNYVYDLEMTRPNGFVETWLNLKSFIVKQDVAR